MWWKKKTPTTIDVTGDEAKRNVEKVVGRAIASSEASRIAGEVVGEIASRREEEELERASEAECLRRIVRQNKDMLRQNKDMLGGPARLRRQPRRGPSGGNYAAAH